MQGSRAPPNTKAQASTFGSLKSTETEQNAIARPAPLLSLCLSLARVTPEEQGVGRQPRPASRPTIIQHKQCHHCTSLPLHAPKSTSLKILSNEGSHQDTRLLRPFHASVFNSSSVFDLLDTTGDTISLACDVVLAARIPAPALVNGGLALAPALHRFPSRRGLACFFLFP